MSVSRLDQIPGFNIDRVAAASGMIRTCSAWRTLELMLVNLDQLLGRVGVHLGLRFELVHGADQWASCRRTFAGGDPQPTSGRSTRPLT